MDMFDHQPHTQVRQRRHKQADVTDTINELTGHLTYFTLEGRFERHQLLVSWRLTGCSPGKSLRPLARRISIQLKRNNSDEFDFDFLLLVFLDVRSGSAESSLDLRVVAPCHSSPASIAVIVLSVSHVCDHE